MPPKRTREPLHIQIAKQLRREVARTKKTGDKLESELALAKRFDTSVLTVREALSALVEQGVVVRRHGSGTYVLDPRARQHVGIFINLDIAHPRTSYFNLRAIQQLRQIMRAAGYKVRLYVGDVQPGDEWDGVPTSPEFVEAIAAGDLCAVAAISTDVGTWAQPLVNEGIPVIGPTPAFPLMVNCDTASTIRHGIERLILQGRKRIAYIGWGDGNAQERVSPILREYKLPYYPEWVRTDLHPSSEGAGWEELRAIWLARNEKPDGLLIGDDMLLMDVAAAILDFDISVPKDLHVVSMSNRGSLVVAPFPVDHMEFDPDALASAMGDRLVRALQNEPIDHPKMTIGFQWRLAADRVKRARQQMPNVEGKSR